VIRRAAAAILVVGAAIGAVAPPAGAVDAVTSGWWWREQPADGVLPPPPHVPQRGLRVASDASGPSAVAAVRIALPPGETNPVLTLDVAAGATGTAVLNACPVKATWKPVSGGAWSSRPEPDCVGGVAVGTTSADGTTVVFDLSPVAPSGDGAVDVVVFPAPQALPVASPVPGAPVPTSTWPTFDVAFAEPTAADVAVTPGAAADDPGAGDLAPVPDPAFDFGATTGLDAPLGAALDLGLLGPAPTPGTVAPRPSVGGAPTGGPAGVTPSPLPRLVSSWDRVGEARDRLLAAFVFVDLLAGWWLLERRRATAVGGDARPRITLHDDPAAVLAAHAARLTRRASSPTIDVPPLR
jgi:hypothetical protein